MYTARASLLVVVALPLLLGAAPQVDTTGSSFDVWLAALRVEALSRGISQATVDLALTNLTPEPVIIARDRMQPEATQSLDAYLAERLKPKVIAKARLLASDHAALLSRVRAAYGIPGPVMVAIWGAESNFGQFSGVRPIVPALATLAFDARRPALFRNELFDALTILDRDLVALPDLKGSWAGAMGQPQFMPSSYLKYHGRLRRRRARGYLEVHAGRLCLDGELPEAIRLGGRRKVGT